MGGYGRPYLENLLAGSVSGLGSRWLELVPPFMLAVAIDAVFLDERAFVLPFFPDWLIPESAAGQILLTVGIVALSFVLESGFHVARMWGLNSFAQRLQHDLRLDTYDTLQKQRMLYFDDNQTGEIMSILNNDVNTLEEFFTSHLSDAFEIVFLLSGMVIVLGSINLQLTLIALLPVPLIAGFSYVWVRYTKSRFEQVRSAIGEINNRLEDNVSGIRVIKTNVAEEFEYDRVAEQSLDYYEKKWSSIRSQYSLYPGIKLSAGVGITLTFLVGGLWVVQGSVGPLRGVLSTGEFVLFFTYTQRLIWPTAQFGSIVQQYQETAAAAGRVLGLLDEDDTIGDAEGSRELVVDEGHVEFEDVTFRYQPGAESALEDLSFEVDGGDHVGVVGPTGAGKSTVFRLLLRLYEPEAGTIRIDGTDIEELTLASLRGAIGYVGQETFLFSGTVRENIAYGVPDAADERIVRAAKAAEAHDFIQNLPDGYETDIGERGAKLSGGQRRRISIARTLLKEPEILLLDEATSDVDTETEMLIQRSIDRLADGRTTFTIAHRLSTIRDADDILVLSEGELVEQGTHEELMEADGLYANFWEIQSGDIESLSEDFVQEAARRRARTGDYDFR